MLRQQQRSHIPKFGSWDADNVPYTAYFENARKDKGSGVMINPNDPEQNPEAFMKYGGNNDDAITSNEKNINSDHGLNLKKQQSYKSDQRKSTNSRERTSNFSPPTPSSVPNKPKYGYKPADDIVVSIRKSLHKFLVFWITSFLYRIQIKVSKIKTNNFSVFLLNLSILIVLYFISKLIREIIKRTS